MRRAITIGRLLLRASLVTLVILALGIGASTIAAGRDLFRFDTLGILAMQFVLTGAPMFLLALRGDGRKAMWVIAVAIMLSFWAFFTWQTRLSYLNDFAGGANIGLGLVMMAAPVFACLVLAVIGPFLRRRQR